MAYFENGLFPNSWVIFALFGGIAAIPLGCMALYARRVEKRPWKHKTATVLVLGDIGRSPRMMYHAESLAKAGWDTYMVGYGGGFSSPASTDARHRAHPLPPRDTSRALPSPVEPTQARHEAPLDHARAHSHPLPDCVGRVPLRLCHPVQHPDLLGTGTCAPLRSTSHTESPFHPHTLPVPDHLRDDSLKTHHRLAQHGLLDPRVAPWGTVAHRQVGQEVGSLVWGPG